MELIPLAPSFTHLCQDPLLAPSLPVLQIVNGSYYVFFQVWSQWSLHNSLQFVSIVLALLVQDTSKISSPSMLSFFCRNAEVAHLSLMVPRLTGTRPPHACCISRMHCHTPFLGLFRIGLPEKPGILHTLLLSMHLFKTHSSATSYTNCSLAGGGAQGSLYFLSTSPAIFPIQELLLPLQLSFL